MYDRRYRAAGRTAALTDRARRGQSIAPALSARLPRPATRLARGAAQAAASATFTSALRLGLDYCYCSKGNRASRNASRGGDLAPSATSSGLTILSSELDFPPFEALFLLPHTGAAHKGRLAVSLEGRPCRRRTGWQAKAANRPHAHGQCSTCFPKAASRLAAMITIDAPIAPVVHDAVATFCSLLDRALPPARCGNLCFWAADIER